MKRIALFAAMVFVLSAGAAFAHHPTGSAGTGQAGPISTISADTLPEGSFSLDIQYELIGFDAFSDSELLGFAARGVDVHSFESVVHVNLGVGYGVSDDLSIGLRMPYVYINDIKEAHAEEPGEVHVHGDSKGIGDLSALVNYRFHKAGGLSVSALAGIKLPTGRTDVKDISGERFEAEHQPGSGSWDPMVGLALTKRFDDISLDANILYTFVTEGVQDTDLGDAFNYNASVSYRAAKPVDLILEANGIVRAKQKIDGARDPNSGEHILYLSPGVKYTWKNSMAYLSAGVPLFENLGGKQTETDYRMIAGITVGFVGKR